jgi:hypothetical protein
MSIQVCGGPITYQFIDGSGSLIDKPEMLMDATISLTFS